MLTTNREVREALNAIDPTRAEHIETMAAERGVSLLVPSDYRAMIIEDADACLACTPKSDSLDPAIIAEIAGDNTYAGRLMCVAMQIAP